ncbi:hypothetical protein SAMN05720470_10810 [Fibrobacter sp. UWOV1]|nr:hypothetical protein SAMN05720470_10810 [Fibrobacter sp. UWOV1]
MLLTLCYRFLAQVVSELTRSTAVIFYPPVTADKNCAECTQSSEGRRNFLLILLQFQSSLSRHIALLPYIVWRMSLVSVFHRPLLKRIRKPIR